MLNGKIVICANSIEEAEADLAMMKAMAATGAVVGCGATTIEGMRGLAEALAPMITDTEPCGVARLAEPQNPFVCCNTDEDTEDYGESEGFTIESAMAYFFGGEWD
jgi:hypothetical protein